jgi:hypothetical protein
VFAAAAQTQFPPQALAVSVFAGDFVSAGADLPPESLGFESPDFESLVDDSPVDGSLDELLFDA